MTDTKPIRRITVVGTGVIGASWSALFLANGLEVVANDVAATAEASLRKFVASAWPALERLGLAPGASPDNLAFTTSLEKAVEGTDFVQENGPERIGLALDIPGGRMFITDFAGTVYSADLDGRNHRNFLNAQGNLTGIAYAEV